MFTDISIEQITTVISDSFSEAALKKWEEFMETNEDDFLNISGEFSHRHHTIYNDFILLVENRISKICSSMDIEIDDFFDCVKKYENVPVVDVFNTLIILTTNFESFADVMIDPRKRQYLFVGIKMWRRYFHK